MTDSFTLSQAEWPLQRQCDFISRLYGLWYGALIVTTYAERGEEALVRWRYTVLHNHQRGYFIEGLRKLGIDPEAEPPAVVAAKYHLFSNALGGLDMQYYEESPKKAWIRYNAPFNPFGTGWLAIPPSPGRAIFAAWHAFNGELLGCPRLGFVLARGFSEDEPYAEGYFMEYDHDLKPEEWIKYDSSETMPEPDPKTTPQLDPEAWPPERRAKAKRNFTRDYVSQSINSLIQLFGVPSAAHITRRAVQGIAIQHGKEFLEGLGIQQQSARGLTQFTKQLSDMAGDSAEASSPQPGKYILRRTARRLFPKGAAPIEVHRALFSFTEMMARIMNRHIKVSLTAHQEEGSNYDEMVFEDVK